MPVGGCDVRAMIGQIRLGVLPRRFLRTRWGWLCHSETRYLLVTCAILWQVLKTRGWLERLRRALFAPKKIRIERRRPRCDLSRPRYLDVTGEISATFRPANRGPM